MRVVTTGDRPVYDPIGSVWEFQFFLIPANTWHCLFSHSGRGRVISFSFLINFLLGGWLLFKVVLVSAILEWYVNVILLWISLMNTDDSCTFSCIWWSLECLSVLSTCWVFYPFYKELINLFLPVVDFHCCVGFLQLWQVQAASRCTAWASHCSGFSCCGAQVLGHLGSVVAALGL